MRLLAVVLALSALPQEKPLPQPWDGFAPGSWVVTIQTHERGKQYVLKQTLNADRSVSTTQADSGKDWGNGLPPGKALTDGLLKVAQRKETLKIGGRTLDCDVLLYANAPNSSGRDVTMTLWKAKEISIPPRTAAIGVWASVPSDIVRAERFETSGTGTICSSLEVTDLDAKLDIHGTIVDCVVQVTICTSEQADQLPVLRKRRHWICDAIPGRLARREEECRQGTGGGGWIVEVADFKALR